MSAVSDGSTPVQTLAHNIVLDVVTKALAESGYTDPEGGSELVEQAMRDRASPKRQITLKQLDVGECQLSDNSAVAVGQLLKADVGLESLSLTSNPELSTAGWQSISEGLRSNTTLASLALDYCNLGDVSIIQIMDALRDNPILRDLDLEGNGIGDEGGRWILDVARDNAQLKSITLMPGNSITAELLREIETVLGDR